MKTGNKTCKTLILLSDRKLTVRLETENSSSVNSQIENCVIPKRSNTNKMIEVCFYLFLRVTSSEATILCIVVDVVVVEGPIR